MLLLLLFSLLGSVRSFVSRVCKVQGRSPSWRSSQLTKPVFRIYFRQNFQNFQNNFFRSCKNFGNFGNFTFCKINR